MKRGNKDRTKERKGRKEGRKEVRRRDLKGRKESKKAKDANKHEMQERMKWIEERKERVQSVLKVSEQMNG